MSEIILHSSEDAAKFVENISGWVSRTGMFYGKDEHAARWAGCTHVNCKSCGAIVKKHYTKCDNCREKDDIERYSKFEVVEWDGASPVYSDACDKWFSGIDEIYDFCEDNEIDISDLRLVLGKENVLKEVNPYDIYDGMGPDDGELDIPKELLDAFDVLNAKIRELHVVASYSISKKAVHLSNEDLGVENET